MLGQAARGAGSAPAGGTAAARRRAAALRANREKPVRSTTLERLRLMRQADELVTGLPQPLQVGTGLTYLLERIGVPVAPDDLLLGRIHEEVPDEAGEALFQETLRRWNGRGVPTWLRDGGHECFAWDRLLRLGLPGLRRFAVDELARRQAAGEAGPHLDWLAGAVLVYRALQTYAARYADAAREAGLAEPAAAARAAAERAPATFAEALQLVWLVGHVYCTMVAPNPTLTFGRLDQLLLPLFRSDLAAGRLTREEAGELVGDFYAKNNLVLGRGEHQMSGDSELATGWARNLTYDAPQYVLLGGRRADGSPAVNELTELMLEHVEPGYENPVIVFRYTAETPDAALRLLAERLRANASILVYNDGAAVPAFRSSGFAAAEAVEWSLYGCNWPTLAGRERTLAVHRPLLPEHVLQAILGDGGGEPGQPATGTSPTPPSRTSPTSPTSPTSIDEVYERLGRSLEEMAEARCAAFRVRRARFEADAPGPLRVDDCFLAGPVARARSWEVGGTEHTSLTFGLAGLATAANSLAAVDELVFRQHLLSLDELGAALRDDFAGHERTRQLCRRAPKFGRDDDRADVHAVRLVELALDAVARASRRGTPDGIHTYCTLTTDAIHARLGRDLGATPDGRRAGEPISENQSPAVGTATAGLTAVLRSLAKLPFDRVNAGPNNLRVQPRLVAGEAGLERLVAILRAYFGLGGLQVQLSFVDTAELRRAQADPASHRDLMVRITGYSAVFVDMSAEAQAEIIRRAELE